MRNPNGYGCIKKLSGQRRRPFAFVVSENGKQRIIEYFTNQADAQIFQADYNKVHLHHVLPGHQVTLAELYHRWLPAHIADTDPSDSALASYANSFKHLSCLQYEPFFQVDVGAYITLPLSSEPIQVVANDMADEHNNPLCLGTSSYGKGKFKVSGDRIKTSDTQLWGHWIAICK